jgi:transcriptional regulator with XRE-family HTH domain
LPKSVHSVRYERFRELLLAARAAAGLSQVELAKMLGRPQSFVSKYERGERRLDVVEFLDVAEALGVDALQMLARVRAEPRA